MAIANRTFARDDVADPDDVIRVAGGSDSQAVASAISNAFYERQEVVLRAVGASAVNQTCKAISIARGYVAQRGVDLFCRIGFTNVEGRDGQDSISAIVFRLSLQ
jgi:stage V sporulation protein S